MHSEKWLKQQYEELPLVEREQFIFVSMKIKQFPKLNRLYGRAFGDELIDQVYQIAETWLHGEGKIAQIHLNLFNLLIKLPAGKQDDHTLLLWISSLANAIYHNPDERYHDLLSIGLGVFRLEKEPCDFYIAQYNADFARSNSKEKDFVNSHVDFYGSSIVDTSLHTLNYQSMFEPALKNGDIKIYLQPKVDLQTGKVTHAEALMRWIDPKLGLLPIHEYIPILDQCGYMNLVDRYVFKEVCKLLLEWKQQYQKDIHISVNLSSNTFVYPFFS